MCTVLLFKKTVVVIINNQIMNELTRQKMQQHLDVVTFQITEAVRLHGNENN